MNIKLKPVLPKRVLYIKKHQSLTTSEVDFMKSRFTVVLNQLENEAYRMKNLAKETKANGHDRQSKEAYKFYAELKVEISKMAKIQYKLKRGLV